MMVFEYVKKFRETVTKYSLQKGVQLEKYVNEPSKVWIRCIEDCPCLLYASLNKATNDFMNRIYIPKHKYVKTISANYCFDNEYAGPLVQRSENIKKKAKGLDAK